MFSKRKKPKTVQRETGTRLGRDVDQVYQKSHIIVNGVTARIAQTFPTF